MKKILIITFLLSLIMITSVNAISFRNNFPTKIENGINISTEQLECFIDNNAKSCYYYLNIPTANYNFQITKNNINKILKKGEITSLTAYPITNKITNEETTEYTLGNPTNTIKTSNNREYIIMLGMEKDTTGSWNTALFDPDIATCPITLNASTNYTLTANAICNGVDAYTIAGANTGLDCNGFSVIGNNTVSKYGVVTTGANTTIKNCNFINFSTPIYGNTGSTKLTIMNSTGRATTTYVTTTSGVGLFLKANEFNVTDSNFSATSAMGALLSGAKNGFITNTNLSAGGATATFSGLYLYLASDNNTFTGGKMTGGTSAPAIIFSTSANNRLNGVDVYSSSSDGYDVGSGASNTIDCQGLTIRGTNTTGTYGVELTSSTNIVKNCIFENWGVGVRISLGGNGNTIDNVTVQNQTSSYTYGTRGSAIFIGSINNMVANSIFNTSTSANGYIAISSSYGNDFINNTIEAVGGTTGYLIRHISGGGSRMQNNTLKNTGGNGIYFDTNDGNTQSWMCWNNFTEVRGTYYIRENANANGSLASCLIDGYWEGNFYPEILNGSLGTFNGTPSSYGTGWYTAWKNATTVGTKLYGVIDKAPMTRNNDASYTYTLCNSTVINSTNQITLTNDMYANGTTCYIVGNQTTSQDMLLDCNGYSIRGKTTNMTFGVGLSSGKQIINMTVRNCNILGFAGGIQAGDWTKSTINNNTIYNVHQSSGTSILTYTGYAIVGSLVSYVQSNNTITDNYLYSRYGYSVIGFSSTGGEENRTYIANNTIYGAIWMPASNGQRISFINNSLTIIHPATISAYSYFMDRANYIEIDCQGKIIDCNGITSSYGAYLNGLMTNVTMKNCVINNCGTGIQLATATGAPSYMNIKNNIINSSSLSTSIGITVSAGNLSTIDNNTITLPSTTGTNGNTFGGNANTYSNNILNFVGLTSAQALTISSTNSNIINTTINSKYGGISITGTTNNITGIEMIANGTGILMTGAGNTIDCNGGNITGANTSGLYGIALNSIASANIRNCNIFSYASSIYSTASSNIMINNITSFNSYGTYSAAGNAMGVLFLTSGGNNTVQNSFLSNGAVGRALWFWNQASGYSLNNTFTTAGALAIYGTSSGTSYLIDNNNFYNYSYVLFTPNMSNFNFTNNRVYSGLSYVYVYGVANVIIKNNVFTGSQGNIYALNLNTGQNGTTVVNNTFNNWSIGVVVSSTAYNNTFYLNNFTNNLVDISDENGTNIYNLTEGNIFDSVLSGVVNITGNTTSTISGLYLGYTGTGYPFNKSNAGTESTTIVFNISSVTANSTGNSLTNGMPGFVFNTTTPTVVTSENLTGTITIIPYAIGSNLYNLTTSSTNSGGWITIPSGIYETARFHCPFSGCGDYAPLTPYITYTGTNTTCEYTSGAWTINCAENCTITNNYLINNNVSFIGSGNIYVSANITDIKTLLQQKGCIVYVRKNVGTLNQAK